MRSGRIPGVGKEVSRIVLGTMVLSQRELEKSFALLDHAMEAGINAYDLAHVYNGGESERAFGRWMEARGNRERVVVITKGSHPNADRKRVTPWDIAADLHDSLARLKTSYIDIYLLHRDDPDAPVGPVVEALNEHHRAGRIRAFGGSNWRHERIDEANRYARERGLVPFQASSPNFGLAEQVEDPWGPGCVTLSGPAEEKAREWYIAEAIPVFAYSSLGRGLFSGRITRASFDSDRDGIDKACLKAYCHEVNFRRLDRVEAFASARGLTVAQVALAYVLSHPLGAFAIVGAQDASEIDANVKAAETALTAEERAWLDLRSDASPV